MSFGRDGDPRFPHTLVRSPRALSVGPAGSRTRTFSTRTSDPFQHHSERVFPVPQRSGRRSPSPTTSSAMPDGRLGRRPRRPERSTTFSRAPTSMISGRPSNRSRSRPAHPRTRCSKQFGSECWRRGSIPTIRVPPCATPTTGATESATADAYRGFLGTEAGPHGAYFHRRVYPDQGSVGTEVRYPTRRLLE